MIKILILQVIDDENATSHNYVVQNGNRVLEILFLSQAEMHFKTLL